MKQRSMLPKVGRESNITRLTDENSRHSSSSSSRFSTDSNNPRLVTECPKATNADDIRVESNNASRLSKDNVSRFTNDNTLISRLVPNEHMKASNENSRSLSEGPGEVARVESDATKPAIDIARRPSAGSLGRLLERHPLLPMPADTVNSTNF